MQVATRSDGEPNKSCCDINVSLGHQSRSRLRIDVTTIRMSYIVKKMLRLRSEVVTGWVELMWRHAFKVAT